MKSKITRLGNHILLQGDCTNIEDVKKLLSYADAGKKPELLFTSPPYADMRDYENVSDLSVEHLAKFIPSFVDGVNYIAVNLGIKRKNCEIVQYWDIYIAAAKNAGLKLMSWNVWEKTSCSLSQATNTLFPIVHEFVFVFGRQLKETNRIMPKVCKADRRCKTHVRKKDGSTVTRNRNTNPSPLKKMESVLRCNSALKPSERLHPAPFSLEFAEKYILSMTNEGDTVVDCFGGSGTTLIACEKHNRKCLTMEINENYIEVIKKRYKDFTRQGKLL